jgi:hypothetical protein
MPAFVTVATDRFLPSQGGAPCRANIVWPNGLELEAEQFGINVGAVFRAQPAIFYCETCEGTPMGYLYKFRPTGQTFTYSNQYGLNLIKMISAKGITSFDIDISQCNNLENISIGKVINATQQAGSHPWAETTNATISSIKNNIQNFNTFFPASTYGDTSNPYSEFNFWYNDIDCNFNPTFQNQPILGRKYKFDFQSNNQTYLNLDCHGFNRIFINNNPYLYEVILYNLSGLSFTQNNKINLNLAGNVLTQFQLKDLSGITNNVSTTTLNIDLSSNNLGTVALQSNTITSFPPFLKTDINFSNNKFTTWQTSYSGASLGRLTLASQSPGLSNITFDSILNSNFKEYDFSNNLLTLCPPISAGTTYLDIRNNNIVANGVSSDANSNLCLPNFVPGMQTFYGGKTAGSTKQNNYSKWSPDNPDQYHTRLYLITSWIMFDMQYANLASMPAAFSPNITSPLSTLDLSYNSITTFSFLDTGGFRNINVISNLLTHVTDLNLSPQVKTINLSNNTALGTNDPTSDCIIPSTSTWPATLYSLNIGLSQITTWKKSFAIFATNSGGNNMYFEWYPKNSSAQGTIPAPSWAQDSVSFIIRDIISGTSLNNGTLRLSPRYNSGVGGTGIGTGNPILYYPLSSQNADTLACLNCLTASTITPCTVSLSNGGTNSTNKGRGFAVRLWYV